jgi:hypothetical protein
LTGARVGVGLECGDPAPEGCRKPEKRSTILASATQLHGRAGMASALEEKEAIREVLAEYCFRLDEGRFAEMAELFAELDRRAEQP